MGEYENDYRFYGTGVFINSVSYTFNESGSFTEQAIFDGNVSYWTKDRFKPPISGYDNNMPTINWTGAAQHE